MAKKNEETKVNEVVVENPTPAPVIDSTAKLIAEMEIKQPVTVVNLDTGEEDKVTIVYKRYTVKEPITGDHLKAAQELVNTPEAQTAALVAYASSQSYQDGKKLTFSKGNYLTPELKRTIVGIMQATPTFADLSAKDCFDRWSKGYTEKKAGALKLLAQAQTADEFADL